MSEYILTETKEHIFTIQLNRPKKKNAITLDMYQGMADALEKAENDKLVRVVLLKGVKDCFSAGNDLMDFLNNPPESEDSAPYHFLENICRFGKPIIAAVNGPAIGIGVTMLLHCDLIYAGESSTFQLPFVNLGLTPEAGSTFLLPHLAVYRKTAELIFLGEFFDSRKALECGIINEVLPDGEVEEVAMKKALRIAEQPPNALRLTKSLLKKDHSELMDIVLKEAKLFVELVKGEESREIITAFMEGRKPVFF